MLSILNKLGKWSSGVAAVARPVFTTLLRHCYVIGSPVVRALVKATYGVVGGTVGTAVGLRGIWVDTKLLEDTCFTGSLLLRAGGRWVVRFGVEYVGVEWRY